jgi:hypothetical protein
MLEDEIRRGATGGHAAGIGRQMNMQQVMRWTRAMLALALVAAASPAIVAQESGRLKVTVDYKGTGSVDASHEIFVWVFDNPNIGADSVPIATDVLTTNGGSLNFSGLPQQVYLAAAFDEKGDYDGTSGPPPPGTPITIYGEMGAAAAVATGGADAAVNVHSLRSPAFGLRECADRIRVNHLRAEGLGPMASYTFRSFVTRPTSTHSTTKMFPA